MVWLSPKKVKGKTYKDMLRAIFKSCDMCYLSFYKDNDNMEIHTRLQEKIIDIHTIDLGEKEIRYPEYEDEIALRVDYDLIDELKHYETFRQFFDRTGCISIEFASQGKLLFSLDLEDMIIRITHRELFPLHYLGDYTKLFR